MSIENAVFIHSYLGDPKVEGKPDGLTRLGILSAAELYRQKIVGKICVSVIPELSEGIVKRLKILLNNPSEKNLLVSPTTVSTDEEVEVFSQMINENSLGSSISVAADIHIPRIEKSKRRYSPYSKTLAFEDILDCRLRYKQVLLDSKSYSEYKSLKKQEKIFDLLGKIPFWGEKIVTQLPRKIPSKISLQERLFKIMGK
jgi:hypothetical protein